MSLLDSRDILAKSKAPPSLSTIGKSYDVASGNGSGQTSTINAKAVSSIAQQQNKTTKSAAKADRWDSAELVESVIGEAEAARRQQQLERAMKSKGRTTLVDRERKRNKERADARLAGASAGTELEGAGLIPSKTDANQNKRSATPTAVPQQQSQASAPTKSANSFSQLVPNPINKLMLMNVHKGENAEPDPTKVQTTNMGDDTSAASRRGATVLSSPRPNPLLAQKVLAELSSAKLDQFLQTTAQSMPNLSELVSTNLSMAATRKIKRDAILARRQRRLLRGSNATSGGGAGNTSGEDFDSEEEEQNRLRIQNEGGVAAVGIRGTMNRQREVIFGPLTPHTATSPTISSQHHDGDGSRPTSPARAQSPTATNSLKIPEGLRVAVSSAQDFNRSTQHATNHRATSPNASALVAAGSIHSVTGVVNTSSTPLVLPSNATFLQLAGKASIREAIKQAEQLDKRLGTSAIIKTSTDKNGNVVKLDGIFPLDENTNTVTAAGIATATQMAKVGANDAKQQRGGKGFFGRSASPLQLQSIPEGTQIEAAVTYKPGTALATLVESKSQLSRSTYIEDKRETSSFNAPPRPALLMPTCAPLHASYHIRYGAVERQGTSPAFAAVPHHKFNQNEKAKLELSRQKKDASLANMSAINNSSGIVNVSTSRAASPTPPAANGGGATTEGTFFNLTQAKLGDKSRNNIGSEDESHSSNSRSGSAPRRRKKNHELVPTGNRPEVKEEAIFKMNNTSAPDMTLLSGPTDNRDYRARDVRDTSSAFKTVPRKAPKPLTTDLFYYPLPEPGLSNYSGGKIIGNARERDYTPFGNPCGARTTYNLDLIDERQRQEQRERQTPAFGKIIGRAEQKHPFVLANIPSVDTSQFDYKDQHAAVEKRRSCYVSMQKQTSRPPTKLATKTEAPHMNTNSIVSVPKKGFVDLGRMTNYDTRDPEYFAIKRANDTTTPLFINDDSVLYTAPSFSFQKGPVRFAQADPYPARAHSSMAMGTSSSSKGAHIQRPKSTEPTDYGYADDSPVRRRAPAAAFPLTDRETRPILRVPAPGQYTKGSTSEVFAAKDSYYDVSSYQPHHVPSASIGPLVSRSQREKALQQRFASTDAVYDVPRTDKIKMVLPFDKNTGRV